MVVALKISNLVAFVRANFKLNNSIRQYLGDSLMPNSLVEDVAKFSYSALLPLLCRTDIAFNDVIVALRAHHDKRRNHELQEYMLAQEVHLFIIHLISLSNDGVIKLNQEISITGLLTNLKRLSHSEDD